MRQLIIILIYFATTLNSIGQDIKIEKSTEKELLISPYFLTSVREFSDSSHLAIKIIELEKSIGPHPDDIEQEVVLSDFLFLVKEGFDDGRKDASANFWIKGKFYNPREFKFSKADKSLTFKYGTDKNFKITTLLISSKNVIIK